MRFLRIFCSLAFLVATIADQSALPAAEKEVSRILMLTQSQGFVHESVRRPDGADAEKKLAVAEIAMIDLGQKTGLFKVDCTQDAAADFTKDNLKNYDIVMFYTTGTLPIAEPDLNFFFKEWLTAKGHGFIGFHSAADTFGDYQPYWDMVGGTFNGHPWNADRTVTIKVHEPDHPTMKPFGSEFTIQDEIYQYKNWQPEKVRVLMSLDMSRCDPSEPYHVPVAWVKPYGEGRVYFNNLGHNESTWSDARFLESVTAGVQWIRGDVEGESKPNPELSAAQEETAKNSCNGTRKEVTADESSQRSSVPSPPKPGEKVADRPDEGADCASLIHSARPFVRSCCDGDSPEMKHDEWVTELNGILHATEGNQNSRLGALQSLLEKTENAHRTGITSWHKRQLLELLAMTKHDAGLLAESVSSNCQLATDAENEIRELEVAAGNSLALAAIGLFNLQQNEEALARAREAFAFFGRTGDPSTVYVELIHSVRAHYQVTSASRD